MTTDPLPAFYKKARPRDSRSITIIKTLLLLALAFGVAAFIIFSFGRVAFESHSPEELFAKITTGRPEVRRMAAVEWGRLLQEDAGTPAPTTVQTESLGGLLESERRLGTNADRQYLASLANLLGFSASPEVARGLIDRIWAPSDAGPPPDELRIYGLLSLARLGLRTPAELQAALDALESESNSVRISGLYALGFLLQQLADSPSAADHPLKNQELMLREKVRGFVSDSSEDVRLNAIFALARSRDPQSAALIDRIVAGITTSGGELSSQQFEVYKTALRLGVQLEDERLQSAIHRVSMEHPNLKLRAYVKDLLKGKKKWKGH